MGGGSGLLGVLGVVGSDGVLGVLGVVGSDGVGSGTGQGELA